MTATLVIHRFDRALTGVRLDLSGVVEKVFQRAAWLRLHDSAGRCCRISLLHPSLDLVPLGAGIPWGLVRPRTGQAARLQGRQLSLGREHLARNLVLRGEGVSMSLPGTPAVEKDEIRDRLAKLELPTRVRHLLMLEPLLTDDTESCALRSAARGLAQLVDELCDSTAPDSFEGAVGQLAGLGPGLTPTGDDLLVGVTAAAHLFAEKGWVDAGRLSSLLSSLDRISPAKTTTAGKEMLSHATRGAFPEPLLRFVTSLASKAGKGETGREAVRLLRAGGTSGSDMMAGVVCMANRMATPTERSAP